MSNATDTQPDSSPLTFYRHGQLFEHEQLRVDAICRIWPLASEEDNERLENVICPEPGQVVIRDAIIVNEHGWILEGERRCQVLVARGFGNELMEQINACLDGEGKPKVYSIPESPESDACCEAEAGSMQTPASDAVAGNTDDQDQPFAVFQVLLWPSEGYRLKKILEQTSRRNLGKREQALLLYDDYVNSKSWHRMTKEEFATMLGISKRSFQYAGIIRKAFREKIEDVVAQIVGGEESFESFLKKAEDVLSSESEATGVADSPDSTIGGDDQDEPEATEVADKSELDLEGYDEIEEPSENGEDEGEAQCESTGEAGEDLEQDSRLIPDLEDDGIFEQFCAELLKFSESTLDKLYQRLATQLNVRPKKAHRSISDASKVRKASRSKDQRVKLHEPSLV